MKKLLFTTAAFAAAAAATPAMAAPTDIQGFFVTAGVQAECSVEDPDNVNFGLLSIEEDAGPDALLLEEQRYVERQRIWTSCNYPTSITLAAVPMQNVVQANDGPDAGDFTDVLHYRLRLRANNNTDFTEVNLRTIDSTIETEFQSDAFHNNAVLRTVVNRNDNPLRPLAGPYVGFAVVALGII